LKKPPAERKKDELTRLAKYIKSIPFFKYRDTGVITDQDSYEIASSLKFEKFKAGEKVVNFGDEGDKFYIILKGVVSVQIQNPSIKDYRLVERDFNKLKEWKKDEFDPKLKSELENKYQKFMYLEVVSEKLKNAAMERRCTLTSNNVCSEEFQHSYKEFLKMHKKLTKSNSAHSHNNHFEAKVHLNLNKQERTNLADLKTY
tara:strand:+ start:123 stop:725 length:603 start_codon:yes stop_codon:yes gene_type:complete